MKAEEEFEIQVNEESSSAKCTDSPKVCPFCGKETLYLIEERELGWLLCCKECDSAFSVMVSNKE